MGCIYGVLVGGVKGCKGGQAARTSSVPVWTIDFGGLRVGTVVAVTFSNGTAKQTISSAGQLVLLEWSGGYRVRPAFFRVGAAASGEELEPSRYGEGRS